MELFLSLLSCLATMVLVVQLLSCATTKGVGWLAFDFYSGCIYVYPAVVYINNAYDMESKVLCATYLFKYYHVPFILTETAVPFHETLVRTTTLSTTIACTYPIHRTTTLSRTTACTFHTYTRAGIIKRGEPNHSTYEQQKHVYYHVRPWSQFSLPLASNTLIGVASSFVSTSEKLTLFSSPPCHDYLFLAASNVFCACVFLAGSNMCCAVLIARQNLEPFMQHGTAQEVYSND